MNATHMADWPHEVHPNRRDHTVVLGDKIAAMTDTQRASLLYWLSGYDPIAVEKAIERLAA